MQRIRAERLAALVLAAGLARGCAEGGAPLPQLRPAPPVRDIHLSRAHEALQRIAVLPFSAAVEGDRPGQAAEDHASLVANAFSEALAARGLTVVPPGDLARAFEAAQGVVPQRDPRAAAALANQQFGATSVVLGRVLRWREREGSSVGSPRPASVAFEVVLYAAPQPRRLWSASFDETQVSVTENVLRARQYPGSGMRWLSAEELARWGAQETARTLLDEP